MKKLYLISILLLVKSLLAQADTVKYQWPEPPFNESKGINGTFCEYRDTSPEGHFHNGTDIGEPDGYPIYSCLDGVVHYIGNVGANSYVRVRTQVDGKWKHLTYVHITPNPSLSVGMSVTKGVTVLGTVYSGQGHVHLIDRELADNANDYVVEINSLRNNGGLYPYIDTWAPIIHSNTLQFKLHGTEIPLNSNALSDKVDMIIKIEEQNGSSGISRNNGTFVVGYRIWNEAQTEVVYEPADGGIKYRFDSKPLDSDVHIVFKKGLATLSDPVYIITNGDGANYINQTGVVNPNYFDTGLLEPNNYYLEIFSEDTRENYSNYMLPITITDEDVMPPTEPVLLGLLNTDGANSVKVMWKSNEENDILGYRLYYTENANLTGWKLAADETQLTSSINEYEIESTENFIIPPNNPAYFFKLTAVDSAMNESKSSDVYARSNYSTAMDYPKVLIVDGFDRYGGTGSWNEPTHSFNTTYFGALTMVGETTVSSAANDAIEDSLINLNDYDYVVWFVGDESTVNRTLNSTEQNFIKDYLENGGKLYISGSEIGWDLGRNHSNSEPNDTSFYHNYLKANFRFDGNGAMNKALGIEGTTFEGATINFGQSFPEDFPDDIDPINGSEAVLNYTVLRNATDYRIAGIAYTGFFGESDKKGKLVYCSFSAESTGSFASMLSLITKVMEYFNEPVSVKDAVSNELPTEFRLGQNYPNPFNPTTTIEYTIPTLETRHASSLQTNVTLKIYDILGREVATLVNEQKPAGNYEVNFNASSLSSGVYFYKIQSGSFTETKKMILLK